MNKTLKTCNCCTQSNVNKAPRFMTARAKIAYCRRCKGNTVWGEMSSDDAAAYTIDRANREAFMQTLLEDAG